MNSKSHFWSLSTDQVLQQTRSTAAGPSRQDAKQSLIKYGANSLKQTYKSSAWMLLLNQFKSPIILILIFAAVLSIFLNEAFQAASKLFGCGEVPDSSLWLGHWVNSQDLQLTH
jgi:P-type Mg2+ transporter